MAMWREASNPFALGSPSPQGGHVGLDPGFVDEHQAPRIEVGLPGPPSVSPMGNGGAGPLKREQRFF